MQNYFICKFTHLSCKIHLLICHSVGLHTKSSTGHRIKPHVFHLLSRHYSKITSFISRFPHHRGLTCYCFHCSVLEGALSCFCNLFTSANLNGGLFSWNVLLDEVCVMSLCVMSPLPRNLKSR